VFASRNLRPIVKLAIALLAVCAALAVNAQPIPGLDPDITFTGYDPSPNPFTYVPITNNPVGPNSLNPEYVKLFKDYFPVKVGRAMDWQQANTNNERNWSDRPAGDYGPNGMSEPTLVNVMNQMRSQVRLDFIPQIHRPALATRDYAVQQGRYWAQHYTGNVMRLAVGNEMMFPYATNVQALAMFEARAEYPGRTDFDALSIKQGAELAEYGPAFREGWVSTGRAAPDLTLVVEGFSPATQYAKLQIDRMKEVGLDFATYKPRIAIGAYAFGSATDSSGLDLSTPQKKRDNTIAWADANLEEWFKQHRQLAQSEGLAQTMIDAYEYKVFTQPNGGKSWTDFQNTQEIADGQHTLLQMLSAAAGGPDAEFMAEGLYGFPMDAPQGQFPLLPFDPQWLSHPMDFGSFRGYASTVDRSSVPEPSAALMLGVAAGMAATRRRAA
jgi:hypothetical protein